MGLQTIGELDPNATYYETMREAYEHRNNVDSLKQTLETKQAEADPMKNRLKN